MARPVVDPTDVASFGSPAPGADDFKIYSSRPAVGFLSKAVQPPSDVYIDTSDNLTCQATSTFGGEVVTVSYRVLTAGGLLVKGQFIISLPVALTRVVHTEPLPEGFLLSVSCSPQIAVTRGTTFVRAFLTDPALGKNISSYMLFADYITNSAPSGFPTGAITASIDGPGNIKTINIFGIAPGADFQANIPANVTWKIRAGQFNFTASAAVANRQCGVQIGSAGATIYTALPQLPVVAGATTTVSYAPSSAASTLNAAVINNILPDPCIIKQPGFIGSFTLNKDAADQYSGGFFLVEEWIQDV